jgi:annexin A7/11
MVTNQCVQDVEALMKAMKGLGTDEKVLTAIISSRSNAELQEIRKLFEHNYKKDLIKEIKSETSGYYEDLLVSLLEEHNEYLAGLVHAAIAGLGTNEDLLIEVICTKNDDELKNIAAAFKKRYGKDMVTEILDDLSGDLKMMFKSIFEHKRPDIVDKEIAKKDAKILLDKGEGQWGTDEKIFVDVFTLRSRNHLHEVSKAYADLTGHSLEVGIAKETSGYFKKCFLALMTPLDEFWGEKVRNAIKGLGTDEKTLIRTFVSNSKDNLKKVNQYYTHKYGNSLLTDVSNDVSGDFGKTLTALIPKVQ